MKALFTVVLAIAVLMLVGGAIVFATIPLSNTNRARFDVIVVLGYPTNSDGSASPVERARVMEAVREYRRGKAPALIMTGGAAHNAHIEADAMADFAIAQGVPASAILREERAQNTVQNAWYSVQMMQAHGWRSVEVVSSRSHLPRASLIFARFPVEYTTHGAPESDGMGWLYDCASFVSEARSTARIQVFGFTPTPYLP